MTKSINLNFFLLTLMLVAAALAYSYTPRQFLADTRPPVQLDLLIPQQFGDWHEERLKATEIINPQTEAVLQAIYTQTLSRSYVNGEGRRIMLSIAYGRNQTDGMQLHYPEVCYPAQGFPILRSIEGRLVVQAAERDLPVKRLVASRGVYKEPITYWTTIGNQVASEGIGWKIKQLRYGFNRLIPDGILFRISEINSSELDAFELQERFVNDLVKALPDAKRQRIIGSSV